MRYLSMMVLVTLASCSSSQVKNNDVRPDTVTNDAFKKDRALKKSEVKDFYVQTTSTSNPGLMDETLDRYSADELAQLSGDNDPLFALSLYCSKQDFKRAFAMASNIYDRYQKVPQYWTQIANCHLNQGSDRKALLFYNKALEVSPEYVPALNNIGVLYSRQGQDQKALVAFERANKQSKFSKTPRYNLAKIYLSYGLADSALPLFQGLSEGAPQDIDLLNGVASSYFLMSNFSKAWSYYQKIPQGHWKSAEIGINVAVTLSKLNRNGDALKVLKSVSSPKSEKLQQYYQTVQQHLGAN